MDVLTGGLCESLSAVGTNSWNCCRAGTAADVLTEDAGEDALIAGSWTRSTWIAALLHGSHAIEQGILAIGKDTETERGKSKTLPL